VVSAVLTAAAGALWFGLPSQGTAGVARAANGARPSGDWWYSQTLDTSAPTVANGRGKPGTEIVEKWTDRRGHEFLRETFPGKTTFNDLGYGTQGGPPGFADWDPLGITTLPGTPKAIKALLTRRQLAGDYPVAADQRTALSKLAELTAMLADDPTTIRQRTAALSVIDHLPDLKQISVTQSPDGQSETIVAERAAGLHPLLIAGGPGCHDPYGGDGCNSTAAPPGSFELRLTYDPTTIRPLSVQTIALHSIPPARIRAGEVMYRVQYLAGHAVTHPHIPALPQPPRIGEQSVPWTLLKASGRTIRVRWESGTCLPGLAAHPHLRLKTSARAVTIAVIARVARAGVSSLCAGVGLQGTLSTTLTSPIAHRAIRHAAVTDHDK
jgi:hypothetical protein